MKFTDDLIDHIAHLSRLQFEGERREQLKADMERVVGFVDKLREVDTDGVEPLIFMCDETNAMREDEVTTQLTHQQILMNAPDADSDYFRIDKVLDKTVD